MSVQNIIALILLICAVFIHYIFPAHTLISSVCLFAAILLHSQMVWGTKRTAIYIISAMIIGYFAEFIGINTSWIFGAYSYNASKDPGVLFGVPLFIPMIYAYLLYTVHFTLFAISRVLTQKSNLWILALLTGIICTLKDLGTDPLRSTIDHVWVWTNGGAYLGVPIHNFLGWCGVFIVLTVVTVPLAWQRGGYLQTVKFERTIFYVPVLSFTIIALFGFTTAFQVPTQDLHTIGAISAMITLFCLLPYIILAWLNGIKKC